ncbi:unnamed protein product [Owenia fusiformis]|uniref:Uncharacterized protein n=1 Tax=Owenia fusiformis TaxID=6347 RepID=A0A8J1Y876_OWEFU|nr:unnamed protein product [Owenia fusiformis]
MADDELAMHRQKRMAELQAQMGGGGGPGGGPSLEQQEEQRQRQSDMKNSILYQVLSQEAIARLKTIAVAKPEKARMLESMIVQMAQRGQIGDKLSEAQFKELLEKVTSQTQKTTTVKFDRRRAALDSDSD